MVFINRLGYELINTSFSFIDSLQFFPHPSTPIYLTSLRNRAAALVFGSAALAAPLVSWSPVHALPEAEMISRVDSILMLMSVDGQGKPLALKATVDGRQVNAYFAAISVAAAEDMTTGQRFSLSMEEASSLRFAPVSFAKFNELLGTLLKSRPSDIGVIVSDPTQVNQVEKLLVAQKIPAGQARLMANQQPMVFCPDPGLLVSANQGPGKGKQFVPCSTEFKVVDSIVQRGVKESPRLAKLKPRVIAIPLNAFVNHLRQSSAERVADLRVLPNGPIIELVKRAKKQGTPVAVSAKL